MAMNYLYTEIIRRFPEVTAVCLLTGCATYIPPNGRAEPFPTSNSIFVHPKPPARGEQIVYRNLDCKFLGISRKNLTIAAPFPEYTGGEGLTSGHLLSAARLTEWRYPLLNGTNVVGAAVVAADRRTGEIRGFNRLSKPEGGTMDALRIAQQWPQIKNQDYEVRRLNIRAIHFVAVWLHGESDDIIVPLPPTFQRWTAYQAYSEREMIELLKPEMEKNLKAWAPILQR
jgi:hypothetical protein